MNNMLVSIIIVSYNNKEVLQDCINSILNFNDIGDRLQIIIVEQSKSNEIYLYIKDHYPQIEVYKADNRGFGFGNNVGVTYAQAPYLIFLNPDTILTSPIAKYTIEKFESNHHLGLFGVTLLDKNRKKTISYENIIPYGLLAKIRITVFNHLNMFCSSKMYIQGADLFVRKETFEKVGGFDPSIFMYGEEADLCTRIKSYGFDIKYYSDKKIIHLQGECSSDNYDEIFKKQTESFVYYCEKQGMNHNRFFVREMNYQSYKKRLYRLIRRENSEKYKIITDKINVLREYMD